MSLDQTIQVLERAMEGKRIVRKSLRPKDISILAAFYSEKEKRPELTSLIEFPDLMYDYLRLDVEDREAMEQLRQINPQYFEGDTSLRLNSLSLEPITYKKNLKKIRQISNKIYLRNGLAQVVEAYIKYQPKTNKNTLVSLSSFFSYFDIKTGQYLTGKKGRKLQIPQGEKLYSSWTRSKERKQGIDFDNWVESQLSPNLLRRLKKTPYYQRESFSISDVVESYIQFQPKNIRGFVSLKSWFMRYDIETGKYLTDKKGGRLEISQGHRFYHLWLKRKQGIDFDNWVESQLSPNLLRRLKKTDYYQRESFSISDVVESYIKFQPKTNRGFVSPTRWFMLYDIETGQFLLDKKSNKTKKIAQGEKLYSSWTRSKERKQGIKFDQWVESQLSPGLLRRLKKTGYYQRDDVSISDVVEAYIQFQPKNIRGFVPLKSWFMRYDIDTGQYLTDKKGGRLEIPQGHRLYHSWLKSKQKKGIEFEEWVLNQVNPEIRNRYISQLYGIRNSESIIMQLKSALEGRNVKTNKGIGYLAAFYAEQEQHPEVIEQLKTPYQIMKYLSLSPEARTATDYRKMDPREKLIRSTLPIS